jgi:NADPH-dependent curcumin reductase CurA
MPVPGDAEVLIRNKYLSIDPYYRHALGPRFLGTRFRHPGEVMMAVTLGEVLESRDPMVPVGSHVTTLLGDMQDYAAVSGRAVRVLSTEFFGERALPLSAALGVAGIHACQGAARRNLCRLLRERLRGRDGRATGAVHGPARRGHRGGA